MTLGGESNSYCVDWIIPWSRFSVHIERQQIHACNGLEAVFWIDCCEVLQFLLELLDILSVRISTYQSSTIISYFLLIHYKFTHFDSSEWSRNTTLMQLPFAAHYSAQRAICMIMIRHLPVFNGNLGANLRSLPFYRKYCLSDLGFRDLHTHIGACAEIPRATQAHNFL